MRLNNNSDIRNGILECFLTSSYSYTRLNEVIRHVYLNSRQKFHFAYFSWFTNYVLFAYLRHYKSVEYFILVIERRHVANFYI